MEELKHKVIASLDCLQHNKLHIEWDTSVLAAKCYGVGFHLYQNCWSSTLRYALCLYYLLQGKHEGK